MAGLVLGVVIVDDLSELGEDLGDDRLELVESFRVDLRYAVDDDDRVDAIGHFGFLGEYVTE